MKYLSNFRFLILYLVLLITASCQPGQAQEITLISGDKLAEMMKENPELQLVDVRTPEEVSFGIIAGATHIDFYDPAFLQKMDGLDKEKPVAVYCAAGGRSASAAAKLKDLGFTEIYDLKDGMRGWVSEGKPVKK